MFIRVRFIVVLSVLMLASPRAAPQQFEPLLDSRLADLLHEELSGELAKEHVIAITRHHRIQGSRGYRASAEWVLEQLRSFGFGEAQAWVETFPSDGRVHYQTWQSPSGWDIESAELRMVEPVDQRIVGYPEIAMSVMTYSNAGHVRAPLVWVGRGTRDADYEGVDVSGKYVLATGYGGDVHRKAVVERGAAAVVCYLDDERAAEYPDMLQYTGMWPRTEELEQVTFGFNLTNRQGEALRERLEQGQQVVLDGRVSGIGLEPFHMDVVVARIEGSEHPEQEIVFSAHLDHPKESANDNASGSAAILDMARGLRTLIESGRLPRPKRTLVFLWVPEFFGTMAWLDAHENVKGPALGGSVLANLNLDMVGENTELLHCRLELTRTPASLPSVVNDVVENVAGSVDRMDVRTPRGSLSAFNYRVTPYSPGSDHMIFIDRKVPGIMFWHSPDYTHHTSEDTPDNVDPVELERCEILAAGSAWYLANLDVAQAIDLVQLTAAHSGLRLGEAGRWAHRRLMAAESTSVGQGWSDAQNALDHASRWQIDSLRSVLSFQDDDRVRHAIAEAASALSHQWTALSSALRTTAHALGATGDAPPPRVTEDDARVPHRLTRGPLAFPLPARALPPERAAWYDQPGHPLDGTDRFEIVNFIDGTRTVTSIAAALDASRGPVAQADVARYLDDLVAAGVVAWN